MSIDPDLAECFKSLSKEARDLYIPSNIQCLAAIPDPLHFHLKWVSTNIPVLIKGAAAKWPAIHKWSQSYLTKVLRNKEVTVAVTPTGYADDIALWTHEGKTTEVFALPEERTMTLSELFHHLDDDSDAGIFYLQKQNSNLTEEFPELLQDIDANLSWASKAFAKEPSAINLWIGDKRSVTSLHKDPFENIYCVVKGWKDFILIPPTDRPWLPYKTVPVAEYKRNAAGGFDLQLKEFDEDDNTPSSIPWIAIDPVDPDLETYPEYLNCSPIHVRVEPGDMLYLPSLWFHHVRQSDGCIAVNFWYDMNIDIKYAYFQLLEDLLKMRGKV